MKQNFELYTKEDQHVWNLLFERQWNNLQEKGSTVYLKSLSEMQDVINKDELPHFQKINQWFEGRTGWSINVVPGLIPVNDFFELLSKKKFCSSTWLRSIKNMDYLEEPDMFHDIFGHIPLLADPVFSSFMEAFGKLGVENKENELIVLQLQRLYWFTIEFGVINEQTIKSYGAGIMSSFGETNHVASGKVNFKPFDIQEIIQTPFKTDEIQTTYFVLESFEQLIDSIPFMRNEIKKTKKLELWNGN
jgi:phenylalanine-4-hydroxylase